MGEGQRAQGADGVGEERMGAVEGVNEALAAGGESPAVGLHGDGGFQRQFVEVLLPSLAGMRPSRISRQRLP